MAAITRKARYREEQHARVAAQFPPLDAGIISEAIPAFYIGRNSAGFWVAREARGRIGGIFLFKSSAVEFANAHSRPSRCALVFPSARIELDLENSGNPLIAQLASLVRLAKRRLRRPTLSRHRPT